MNCLSSVTTYSAFSSQLKEIWITMINYIFLQKFKRDIIKIDTVNQAKQGF